MEDDLQEAIAENAASLAEIDEALISAPADGDLLQVRQDLQAAREELLAALPLQSNASLPQPLISSATDLIADSLAASSGAPGACAPAGPLLQATVLRRPHAAEPDFLGLAKKHLDLAPYVRVGQHGHGMIDFTNFEASRQLTRALLAEDYGVSWWVPDGHLIPPVTNRANYIHWLHDLLELCPAQAPVRVLDIGCGANLIYPLLGAAMHGWHFVGVDITDTAIEWAGKNAATNPHLAHLLEVRRVPLQGHEAGAGIANKPLSGQARMQQPDLTWHTYSQSRVTSQGHEAGVLTPAIQEGEAFTFTMCNPPFFESIEEAGQNPATAFSGTATEMACPGGELAFVTSMVTDSLQLKDKVAWFTTMVGKKETLKKVKAMLHALSVPGMRSTQFTQGRTHRWGLAWSFRAPQTAARKQSAQAPTLARTKHTFGLTYPKGDPSRLLSLLASTVEAHSGKVEQQPQHFLLRAQFQEQQIAQIRDADDAGLPEEAPQAAAPNAMSGGQMLSAPEAPFAATPSASAHVTDGRSVKRQRTSGSAHDEGMGTRIRQIAFRMAMSLRQESVGSFVVLASLQQDKVADPKAAIAFTAKCHAIQQDIQQLLASMH